MQLLCHPQQTSMQHRIFVGTEDKALVSLPFICRSNNLLKQGCVLPYSGTLSHCSPMTW